MIKKIESVKNLEVIAACSLHKANERRAQQRFLAEGMRVCKTFLEAGWQAEKIFVTEEKLAEIEKLVPASRLRIITDSVLKKMSQTVTPSGIIAQFPIPRQSSFEQLNAGIVLANITDPGNMGTLIRTCAAMGKRTVIIIEGVDIWNAKVVQASAGAIALVDIFELTWQELLQHKKNMPLYALVPENGESITKITNTDGLLIVGNEARGIPDAWLAQGKKISIEMPGSTESLNAAIAGAIAMYIFWGNK